MPGTQRFYTSVPNRERQVEAKHPNRVWVGDVTYLRSGGKWRFLAVVMDKCSRKVLGWAVGKNRDAKLTLTALNRVARCRPPSPGLIFHSDRGVEFGAAIFKNRLSELGIVQSMNRPLRMNDNACMESFFHSFKSDGYHGKRFASDTELKEMLRRYLPFYNQERIHSALGYQSPVQYESTLC
jgi:transposase InsO family protein